ncbi:unnamed protein product [Paramecium pentaurelia]|uniref:Uncharacterized protein n=1 Tax=Paramecium pentaurelia TaxID=43138 RepID=A0A8S1YK18_9CILI|nr:unnamed protein product [Paramecium pentaurelia]
MPIQINGRKQENQQKLNQIQYKRCNNQQRNKVRFNMQSIQAKEMNYEVQKAKIQWQIEGVIEGTLGRQTVDFIMDVIDAQKLGKGLFVSASIQGVCILKVQQNLLEEQFHIVGIGLTAFMKSISVGGVILSDCLSQSEKVYNFYCSENWKCYRIRQCGMELGAAGGPIGVVIGEIIGGFIGEVSGNLLGKAIDHFTQFNLQIDFNQNKKSKVEDGYLAYLGTPLKISWKYVKDNIKSLILMAQTDTHMAFLRYWDLIQ